MTLRLQGPAAMVRLDRTTGSLREREYELSVLSGPDKGLSVSVSGPTTVGTAEGSTLQLTDAAVSGAHLELVPRADGVWLRDLKSTNGTFIGAARVQDALLEDATTLKLGRTQLRLGVVDKQLGVMEGPADLAGAIGQSHPMRQLFGLLGRVAPSDSPVVLLGETGTGKEVLARAIHTLSPRHHRPFVVFDCSAVSPNLIESELFGHKKGAFTGAAADRDGAFAAADGGTLFLDEIGELAVDLQPKLLRVLESGAVKPVGTENYRNVDVRIVAATHRDLEAEVAAGRFRQDLFFRLSVVPLSVPPLRDRLDDIPFLARHFMEKMGAPQVELAPALLEKLCAYEWPGNVRELRNVVARALIHEDIALEPAPTARRTRSGSSPQLSVEMPFKAAKEKLVDSFTRDYLEAMLARHQGNITHAAKAAGIARAHLHKLVEKYGLKGS